MNERIFGIARCILISIAILSIVMMVFEGVEGNYRLYGSIVFFIAAITYVWHGTVIYRKKPKMAIMLFVLGAMFLAITLLPLFLY